MSEYLKRDLIVRGRRHDSLSIQGGGFRRRKTLAEGAKLLQITRGIGVPDRWRGKVTWLQHFLVAKHHLDGNESLAGQGGTRDKVKPDTQTRG